MAVAVAVVPSPGYPRQRRGSERGIEGLRVPLPCVGPFRYTLAPFYPPLFSYRHNWAAALARLRKNVPACWNKEAHLEPSWGNLAWQVRLAHVARIAIA